MVRPSEEQVHTRSIITFSNHPMRQKPGQLYFPGLTVTNHASPKPRPSSVDTFSASLPSHGYQMTRPSLESVECEGKHRVGSGCDTFLLSVSSASRRTREIPKGPHERQEAAGSLKAACSHIPTDPRGPWLKKNTFPHCAMEIGNMPVQVRFTLAKLTYKDHGTSWTTRLCAVLHLVFKPKLVEPRA